MKKILVFLLVFIIALMPFLSNAYSIPSYIQEDIDNYEHMIMFRSFSGEILIWLTDNPDNIFLNPSTDNAILGRPVVSYISNDNGVTWSDRYFGNSSASFNFPVGTPSDEIIIDSTFDLVRSDGTVFFSPPKPPIRPLVEVAGMTDFGMILTTISHGLTLVVGCLVLVICFQKAWGFLQRQLTT